MFDKTRQRLKYRKYNRDETKRRKEKMFWQTSKSHDVLHELPRTLQKLSKVDNTDKNWATRKAPDVWATVYASSKDADIADEAVREYMKRVRKIA